MERVVERSNLWLAYQRVVQNKGAPGVDDLAVTEFKDWLKVHWPSVKKRCWRDGTCRGRCVEWISRSLRAGYAHRGADGGGPADPAGAASGPAAAL